MPTITKVVARDAKEMRNTQDTRTGFVSSKLASVAGVRKGRERELGRETTREGGGRRERLQGSHFLKPSRLLVLLLKKITKVTQL